MPRLGLFIWATIYWGYRREVGEPQITFNYVRALADFINNFSFSRGVHFTSAKEYQHIIPALCKRIWEIDNEKTKLMWEMGQQGGVSGDVFVKIAYEPAWTTGIGPDGLPIEGVPQIPMAGRVKILPLNSAFCLTEDTEILTKRGWLHHADLTTLDEAASLNPETNEIVWTSVEQVNVFDWDGPLAKWENERFDVLSTPEHRWIYKDGRNKASIKLTSDLQNSRHNGGRLIVAGGESHLFAETATFTDDFVRLVGWFVTEGHWFNKGTAWQAPGFTQSASVYPQYADEIHSLLEPYEASRYVYEGKADVWYAASLRETMLDAVGLDKRFDINLLQKLTVDQAQILFETLIKGDGNVRKDANTTTFAQSDPGRVDDFQTLCMMLGKRTNVRWRQRSVGAPTADITMYSNDTVNVTNLERTEENYVGKVWCPTTGTGTWVARRNGISFYTGNCFPEWHPHDRDRLLRFKLKYRFWGCLDTETEALTQRGWVTYDQMLDSDQLLTIDPVTDEIRWEIPSAINVYDYEGEMVRWSGKVNALATPNHRWLGEVQHGRDDTIRYERQTIHGEFVNEVRQGSRLVVGGGLPLCFADEQKWTDDLVELVGWYITEGVDHWNQTGTHSVYLSQKNPKYLPALQRLAASWRAQGASFNEYAAKSDGVVEFYVGRGAKEALFAAAPDKRITPEFLTSLTYRQAELLRKTLLDADGCRTRGSKNTIRWTQIDRDRKDSYQMLCAMLGIRSNQTSDGEKVQEYSSRHVGTRALNESREHYDGKVWCPTVSTGYFMARRGTSTYWTGNTSQEGTRQVFTYTEILTDNYIEEYINDELLDSRPNPLGMIPIVHIPNITVSGSPWGLSDIGDVTALNQEYNQKVTDVSDIINYHAAPVTIITGAKASNLEKGPKKVWGGLPKDANVFNLENAVDLGGPMAYLEMLKRAMHEMTGVPETALGQVQPISNTSGVALAVQYQPMMQRYNLKRLNYSIGFKKVNEFCLRTLFLKEPETVVFNPDTEGIMGPGMPPVVDPNDPLIYLVEAEWPAPLPVDKLIKLQEILQLWQMGLESKKGALKMLGEEFPDEKLAEVFEELIEDAKRQGALDLINAEIASSIMAATGMSPEGMEAPAPPEAAPADGPAPPAPPGPKPIAGPAIDIQGVTADIAQETLTDVVTRAYGSKQVAMRKPPSSS
jgi:hypothetical protein